MLADLQGPKIRLGEFPGGPVRLTAGDEFTITTDDIPGDRHEASTTYQGLADDVRAGDRILIDDGNVQLDVTGVSRHPGAHPGGGRRAGLRPQGHQPAGRRGQRARADRQGPGRPALGAGDRRRTSSRCPSSAAPDDAMLARKIMNEAGRSGVPLIAKIEKPEAVRVLPEIVDAFDGIMVARGDLGVELPLEQVPAVQSRAIALARERARPVIVATQMLESMISAPRPTRAEVSDVAGAVVEGADAVMLSAETSVGAYPVETVATMARIVVRRGGELAARRALADPDADHDRRGDRPRRRRGRRDRRGQGAGRVHHDRRDRAAAGQVPVADPAARVHHRARHPQPAGPHLGRGDVHRARPCGTPTTWCTRSTRALVGLGRCAIGDKIVIVAGSPPGSPGKTNALRVHRIGDAIEPALPLTRVSP